MMNGLLIMKAIERFLYCFLARLDMNCLVNMDIKSYGCLYPNIYFVIIVNLFNKAVNELELKSELKPSLK